MAARKAQRKALVVRDTLTEEEQVTHAQKLVLKRAVEIKQELREKRERLAEARQEVLVKAKALRLLKRCRACKAMKFYLKNGKKKP